MILAGYKSNAHLMGPAAESLKGLAYSKPYYIIYSNICSGKMQTIVRLYQCFLFLTVLLPAQAALPDGHFLCLPDEGVPAFPVLFLNSARSIVSSAWALHC